VTPSQAPKAAPAVTRNEARQQIRELQAKQREELRGKPPAERQQLRAQQREQVRDLVTKQREQRTVGPDTQQAGQPKTDAQTRVQDRQQLRELQAKQREELRGKTPAERQQLRAQQRDQVRDLVTKQREQRTVGRDAQQAGQLKTDAQTRLQDRQQLRDLQARQRQELRNRNLKPAERRELIAKQRDELRSLRAEQQNRRLGIQQQEAQRNQQGLQNQQRLRRDGTPRVTEDVARRGRFASRFQNNPNWQARKAAWIASHVAAREAWRHKRRPVFVAWLGPVFYPYAYSDIFEYTFWPYAYDEGYWAYAYDDFVDSMFWAEASPYSDYAYGGPSPRRYTTRSYTTGAAPSGSGVSGRTAAPQICTDPGKGITAWPFAQIEQAVRPTAEQRQLLDDMKRAAAEAADVFKASCEQNFPLTPPGRLAAMTSRLDATLQAVRTVRPALEAFYNSLSDEQKARFTAIGPDIGTDRARTARANTQQQQTNECDANKPGLTNLPIERIEDAVKPTQQQLGSLDKLDEATSRAVELLAAACPDDIPLTPIGRLEAMEKRLDAMVQAGKTVQPALEEFYASLSNEQKARFNTLGQQAERGGG
jgi:hypothetical protein